MFLCRLKALTDNCSTDSGGTCGGDNGVGVWAGAGDVDGSGGVCDGVVVVAMVISEVCGSESSVGGNIEKVAGDCACVSWML